MEQECSYGWSTDGRILTFFGVSGTCARDEVDFHPDVIRWKYQKDTYV